MQTRRNNKLQTTVSSKNRTGDVVQDLQQMTDDPLSSESKQNLTRRGARGRGPYVKRANNLISAVLGFASFLNDLETTELSLDVGSPFQSKQDHSLSESVGLGSVHSSWKPQTCKQYIDFIRKHLGTNHLSKAATHIKLARQIQAIR